MKKPLWLGSLSVLPLLVLSAGVAAQTPVAPAPAPAPAGSTPTAATGVTTAPRHGPSDPKEIEAFLDGLMSGQMKEKNVAGATVAVVRDGRVIFAKGYGWADLDKHVPVDPEKTLFRIGSVSKLFTWTAVMQLVEQGKLDLHKDVNEYLDFKIPATYPQPITLWNLMTHTPGFEDRGLALFSESKEPRGKFLAAHLPARVRPPGTYSSYSNYGTALAGYIVERVSGEPWEEYIERHIMQPLGMKNATGRQPLPPNLAPQMSVGYAKQGGHLVAKPFEVLIPFAPAGSVSASAADMGRFMIAHLQNGQFEGARILADSTARLMHSRAFDHDPRLDGYDLGFYEQTSHGVHLIGHGGDTGWFHTDLSIAPEEGWGVFVSYNSAPGSELSFGPFLQAVLDHYYPVATAAAKDARGVVDSKYLGTYRMNRGSYTTFEKALGLAYGIKVARDPKTPGILLVNSPLGAKRFVAAGPNLFREVDGNEMVAFQQEKDGSISHFFMNSAPMMAMERLAWYQTPALHQVLLGIAVLLLLTVPFVMFGSWRLHRRFRELPPPSGGERLARWTALVVTVLVVAFLVGLGATISGETALLKGNVPALGIVLALPVIAALLTLALLAFAALAWRGRWWGRWGRAHYTAVTVAAVVLVAVLAYWNLLGWKY
ncbi:MAG TPA: serine hydrolase domain-containing protein [Longimicrobiales bacterium]|nr:serine hydrolase domain-containing protein [Longimicrobiales bacterium]